jgi:hypothetical protein
LFQLLAVEERSQKQVPGLQWTGGPPSAAHAAALRHVPVIWQMYSPDGHLGGGGGTHWFWLHVYPPEQPPHDSVVPQLSSCVLHALSSPHVAGTHAVTVRFTCVVALIEPTVWVT